MSFLSGGFGASLGYIGQKKANESNRDIARETNAFNLSSAKEQMKFASEQAQINRDYQTNMSNTQYQRGIEDMKKAGLNPALAYTQGGASSPSGSSPSGSSASGVMPTMQNELSKAVDGANLMLTVANAKKVSEEAKTIEEIRPNAVKAKGAEADGTFTKILMNIFKRTGLYDIFGNSKTNAKAIVNGVESDGIKWQPNSYDPDKQAPRNKRNKK